MAEETASVPFRSATPQTAVATPSAPVKPDETTQSTASDNADAPPSLWQELEKQPYAVKHLDMSLYATDSDFPEVAEQAQQLDDYVQGQIKARGMKDSAASYKEVVDAMYKEIGKSPNEDPTKSLRRLATAAQAFTRLQEARLPSVLNAKNLTTKEFEDIQP